MAALNFKINYDISPKWFKIFLTFKNFKSTLLENGSNAFDKKFDVDIPKSVLSYDIGIYAGENR